MHPLRQGLLILLVLSLSFAADLVNPINLTFAVPMVAILVVIMLAMTTMLSNSISDPRLEAWAKTELREFAAALILITLIIGFFISSQGISYAITGTTSYVSTSVTILQSWLSRFDGAYILTILAATRLRLAATFAPYINIPLWYVSISYSTNPLAGVAILITTLTMASQGLTNGIFLLESIKLLVIYMQVIGPPILLPLSFIFRLIPFTRKLGNTLIAITIAGMVFLPFAIILTEALNTTIPASIRPDPKISFSDFMLKLSPEPISLIMSTVGPLCESKFIRVMLGLTDPLFALVVCIVLFPIPIVGPGLFSACFSIVQYVVYPLVTEILQLIMMILLVAWELAMVIRDAVPGGGYGITAYDALAPFLRDVNNLVFLTYIDIIMIMTVTVSGARSLSAAIGGEWYMAGIQRLI
jgi:hypothetical protein